VLQRLKFPVIGSPLFIISNPKLVIAQCTSGVVGSMPALNARPASQLDEWLAEITEALAAWDRAHPDNPAAPFAINQIVHKSNDRLDHDMQMCAKYKVPIVITSLGAREDVNQAVHGWGGIVLHDIINNAFAKKAVEFAGHHQLDNLILIYDSNLVPVGRDQKQHVEVSRDIALKFNHLYGETFVVPEPQIRDEVAVIPGTDGQKMSKSYGNTIDLFGDEKATRKKIMSIVMDSRTPQEPKPDADRNIAIQLLKLVPAHPHTPARQ